MYKFAGEQVIDVVEEPETQRIHEEYVESTKFVDSISVENYEPPSYEEHDNKANVSQVDLQTKIEQMQK